jgi:dTDP-4-dehydrorhamnose reductase
MMLVFGGHGQLGREIADEAAAHGLPVVAVPRSEADVTSPDEVAQAISTHRPAVVINAAAYTKVDDAETQADEAFRINEKGAATLARACTAGGIPLIHISTDYVFDGSKAGPYRENDPVAPLGVYGRSKAAGEAAVASLAERYVILRSSWLYGVHGANFLKTILRLAGERDELQVVADQRGCPSGTADLAQAILLAAQALAADAAVSGTYHFAGNGVATWHEFATEIVAAQSAFTGRRPPVRATATADYPRPASRPANSELDSSRFAATFSLRAMPWRERTHQVVAALLSAAGPVAP